MDRYIPLCWPTVLYSVWKSVVCLIQTEDLFALNYVFLPCINHQLFQFANALNRHLLRTENGLTPLQSWNQGLLSASIEFQSVICNGMVVDEDYMVLILILGPRIIVILLSVRVPEIEVELTDSELAYIHNNYNPLQSSDDGVPGYIHTA